MSKWGSNGLMPSGTGNAANNLGSVFGEAMNVANQTGMKDQAMGAIQQNLSGNFGNEQQVGAFYQLLASHPNEVALFLLSYTNEKGQPSLLAGLAQLMEIVMKKTIFEFFNGDAFKGDYVDAAKAAELGYSTITQENIDMVIANMVPLQQMVMDVQADDQRAMQIVQQAQFHAMSMEQRMQHEEQQRMMQQQQWQSQQQQQFQQPPQRPGVFGNMLRLGGIVGAGAVGGTAAQNIATQMLVPQPQQQQQGYPQQYPQQAYPPQNTYMHGQVPPQ